MRAINLRRKCILYCTSNAERENFKFNRVRPGLNVRKLHLFRCEFVIVEIG